MFLVVSISLMVVAALNMAGSDITDSAMQSDAVEALFIAESGVEYASYLYANGSACPDLVGTTDGIGRGNFAITAAVLTLTGECRIEVQGTVSQAHPVQRLIEAELRLNEGGVWAVGNGGTILEWNGAAWVPHASGTTANLNGVHCVSANDCWAVGAGVRLHWDGTAWSQEGGGLVIYSSVACIDDQSDRCYAAGSILGFFPIVQRWNGVGWSNSTTFGFQTYLDTACSAGRCYFTGNDGRVMYSDGGALVNDNSGISNPLNGISCTSEALCWAVGDKLNGPNAYAIYGRDGGGSWSSSSVPSNPSRDLHAVDCFAPDQCWAVGERRSGNAFTFAYRNGAGWAVATPGLGDAEDLNGVGCSSSGQCWAVGDNGATLYWDGSAWNGNAWTVTPSGVTARLNDVYFLGSGGGGGVSAVTLVRWREPVQ
jgi:hypothetical protein